MRERKRRESMAGLSPKTNQHSFPPFSKKRARMSTRAEPDKAAPGRAIPIDAKIGQTAALRWRGFVEDRNLRDRKGRSGMTRSALFSALRNDRRRPDARHVLVADHARRDLPEEYGSLGLPEAEFDRHIAYDIGVEPVTRGLAQMLGVPAIWRPIRAC
jgi:hypothetical protein